MGKKGKKRSKKGKKSKRPAPPPEETNLLHIGNFATLQTNETSVTLTPIVVSPSPDKTDTMQAIEELNTCGMLRMHIELNREGFPEYQIKLLKPGEPEMEELCQQRLAKENRATINYELEEHNLPAIKTAGWLKEPLVFPLLDELPARKLPRE